MSVRVLIRVPIRVIAAINKSTHTSVPISLLVAFSPPVVLALDFA